jgi:hypothetical protein
VRTCLRHALSVTGPQRFVFVMRSRWAPRVVLLYWLLIILWINWLSRNDAGASHTVTVIASTMSAFLAIGWFLLARRARCRDARRSASLPPSTPLGAGDHEPA